MLLHRFGWLHVLFMSCLLVGVAPAEESFEVLPAKIDGVPKHQMMRHYLHGLANRQFEIWRAEYNVRKSPDEIVKYQKNLKAKFHNGIGGLPAKTPLNAKTTSKASRAGYTVENVLFESQPRHYVSAGLFLPDSRNFQPPYPGVLVVCGHSAEGKNYEKYQKAAALLALNGIAALIVDPIHQLRAIARYDWPARCRTKHLWTTGVRHGPCRLPDDAGAPANIDLLRDTRLL